MTEFEKDLQNEGKNTSPNENASQSKNTSPNENANQIANESEKIYTPKPEYAAMRKGFKGFWWNIVNYAMLSPTDKKKVTKRLIVERLRQLQSSRSAFLAYRPQYRILHPTI